MTERRVKYFDVLAARAAYAQGRNVTEFLRTQKNLASNTPEIIETAYDLQAGTYIDHVERNPLQAARYAGELAGILGQHLRAGDSLLDIGCGELTTLSLVVSRLGEQGGPDHRPSVIHAFDISWSRIFKGLAHAEKHMGPAYNRLRAFVGDIAEIPLPDKSVTVTTSSHALEPNGGALEPLMAELFRVTVDKLVLFEPCYEINTEEGRRRMDSLGYIKNVDGVVEKLGGRMIEKVVVQNAGNPLNPTVAFIVAPPASEATSPTRSGGQAPVYCVPGTEMPLARVDNFYCSARTGLCYPVLKGIPILKSSAAVLATALLS
jgi:SAM-dependent methyltransferase